MYDVSLKSAIFGVRNADKVATTNDKGRVFADVGQFTNAAKAAAQLDNALGKGAQAAINAMGSVAQNNKALETFAKGANWAANHVNPLLIGAAGYRVVVADDKEHALKREVLGMSSMFAGEAAMKEFFKSNTMNNFKAGIKNPKLRTCVTALEGVLFVLGSIASSNVGYKIGDKMFANKTKRTPQKNKIEVKDNKVLKTTMPQKEPVETKADKKTELDDYEKDFFNARKENGMIA